LFLYAATLFLGAALLFVVQPMMGTMILPLLGGTPAVWNTCMVFFQAALLGGYAYAHASTAWLGVRRQSMVHLAVLALPLALLPPAVSAGMPGRFVANPVLYVLLVLSTSVGVPFLVVSATAPLVQKWFAHTSHRAARDPYFLYAASNLGSMLALLAYPALIEPHLPLRGSPWLSQTRLWSAGYVLLALLTAVCAVPLWRSERLDPRADVVPDNDGEAPAVRAFPPREDAGWSDRLRWIVLAFVPSSLLLGATTYITTDIAAVPLLWVVPLAIYLLTFIVAFARWSLRLERWVTTVTRPMLFVVIFLLVAGFHQRIAATLSWHLALLFAVALSCHGELALRRPSPRRLTEFYMLVSLGGVLGGLFNALVAPVVFRSLAEYPLAMVLGAMLLSVCPPVWTRRALLHDVALAVGVGVLALALASETVVLKLDLYRIVTAVHLPSAWVADWLSPLEDLLTYGPPIVACFFLRRRPIALGLGLASVLVVGGFIDARNSHAILRARSFFGALQVSRDESKDGFTELRHGTTLHGRQHVDPEQHDEPLSYYSREGPIGQVFDAIDARGPTTRVAVLGLGAGTLAAYAREGDVLTFYEIDRLVRDIAFDPSMFTYVSDARARGATIRLELGDARVRFEAVARERPGERYDLIVLDAFTSDAIPVHLLTREALRLYLGLLAPDGLIALHISNRYLALEPVVANLAEDAGLGGRLIEDDDAPATDGATGSTWVVLARRPEAVADLASDTRWTSAVLEPRRALGVWTDDFHNLLSVFKW
jgi:SAM-dependent methyltransferase